MQREEDLMMFEEGETMEEEGMMVEDHQQGGMNMEGEAEEELVEAEEDLYGYRRHQQTQGGQSSAGFGLRHLLTRAAATASSSATVVQSASATVSSVLHWAEDDFVAAVGAYDVGARIQRLVWMGDRLSNCTTSPSAPSASTAYKLACLQLTAHSCNAQLYAIVYAKYKQLQSSLQHLPGSDLLLLDEEWLNATNRTNRAKLDKLESELRNYKSNLIKESIRVQGGRALRRSA